MSLSPESSFTALHASTSPNVAMSNSTPPTTVADSASVHSDVSKHDNGALGVDAAMSIATPTNADRSVLTQVENTPTSAVSRRGRRVSAPVYNLAKLSGTAGHGKRRAKGDVTSDRNRARRRRTIARALELAKEKARLEEAEMRLQDQLAQAQVLGEFTQQLHTDAWAQLQALPPLPPGERDEIEEAQRREMEEIEARQAELHRQLQQQQPRVSQPIDTLSPAAPELLSPQPVESPLKQRKKPGPKPGWKRVVRRTGRPAKRGPGRPPKARLAVKPVIPKHIPRFPNLSRLPPTKDQEPEPKTAKTPATRAAPGLAVASAPTSTVAPPPKPKTKISRELKRLQDTKEFLGIEDKPVVYTVWAKGKQVPLEEPAPRTSKRTKAAPEPEPETVEEDREPIIEVKQPRSKKYLDKGLYAGQETPLHHGRGLTTLEKKKLATIPELIPSGKVNKTMPQPMFHGIRSLIEGRDFKLPFSICSPLPPGQPKPDEWKKMTKNRFIGDSKEYWRRQPHFHDYQSKCVCTPEDGCTESCQNRIMFYECDDTNCNAGRAYCHNRAFADLTARRAKGGKFRVGVEVIKTADRGYGVRSNRCFEPNQIIMEYAGEIITADECERRMREVYKDNECYYLMSFDQNMIIDATSGSIARFVNHSCNPNCRMTKWIVSGQPRMALFAGDKPIMTGDELTYDYNFDPFSAKHVQKCLCGSHNCRGVLGPKSREVKPPKANLQGAVKGAVKAGKRKLQELIGADATPKDGPVKKRKIKSARGVKGKLSGASAKVAKGAAAVLKESISTISRNTQAALRTTATTKNNPTATSEAMLKKTAANRVVNAYGRTKLPSSPKKGYGRRANVAVARRTAASRFQNTAATEYEDEVEVTQSQGGTTTALLQNTAAAALANFGDADADPPRKSGRVTRSPRKALENAAMDAYEFGGA